MSDNSTCEPAPPWGSVKYAPKNGKWLIFRFPDGREIRAHWGQDLSGEEQPPYAGWFVPFGRGCRGFVQIDLSGANGWKYADA